ncbi:DMT family transporter [Achromobacter sp.]|uniref:DMT family transporter n=1 Tax=Achromobacter sp. TaxID=134375 RepID=UPI0028A65D33|nr:DMT family transporter [Achromobacter sp.]
MTRFADPSQDAAIGPAPVSQLRRPSRQTLRGLGWAALSVLIFAGWFVVTRFSVTRELRLWDVTALRFGIGAVILFPVLLRGARRISAKQWAEGLLYACLWGMPFVLAVALGLQLTSAGRAAAVTPTLMPVFVGLFAWVFLKERPGRGRWLGYLAIVIGLVCMVAGGASAHGVANPVGLLALVTAAAMWAVYTLLFRRSALTPVQAAALICFWSAVLFLPVYLFAGLSRLALASPGEIGLQAFYQGVLMSGVAIVSFNRSVALLGPSAATAIIALIPAVAALAAIPVLGELPSWEEGVALLAVVGGVLMAARPKRQVAVPSTTTTARQQP